MRDCIFVFDKKLVQDYFDYNQDAEFLLDYIKYASSEAFVCANVHSSIREQTIGKESSYQYISSVLQDGGNVTGDASFGTEEKDLLFLAGMLSLTATAKNIIIVAKDQPQEFNIHNDVVTKLAEKGVSNLDIKLVPIQLLVTWIRTFDTEFMSIVAQQYGGTY
jgi:hypothetical protein